MSWTEELYKVYENHCGKSGETAGIEDEDEVMLPISHSTANAQIEVLISAQGEFLSAKRIEDKKQAVTIIPVTEDSGARSSGIAPHPLADKLIYIAGDYQKYLKGKNNKAYYQAYMKQLKQWEESESGHPAVTAIYKYLEKGVLMENLIDAGVLRTDETRMCLDEKEKINGIAQADAFVRFRVSYQDFFQESQTWKDQTLYDSFSTYNNLRMGNQQLCYATGKVLPVTYKHPSKIRNAGDKAKLISSNDENGFTYRGRFQTKEQAISVSYDFSQKMHNALKWLIARQGISVGSLMLLVWESNLTQLPNILDIPEDDEFEDEFDEEDIDDTASNAEVYDTLPAYRERLRKSIWGNEQQFDIKSEAVVLGLDSATTGRLSISLYSQMRTSDLMKDMEQWHSQTAWYRFRWKRKKKEICSFSLYEIVDYAFGTEQNGFIKCKDDLKSDTFCRLIPCIIEGRKIPADIVRNLVAKASKPLAYEKKYNWRSVLECACGMIKKSILDDPRRTETEEEIMEEIWKRPTRDCLYGRLLAVADVLEASTYEKGSERVTNAMRYFEVFANSPCRSWEMIHKCLVPYMNRMPYSSMMFYKNLIGEITVKFKPEDYMDNAKLGPEFLLAYYCQLEDLYKSKKKENKEEKQEEE